MLRDHATGLLMVLGREKVAEVHTAGMLPRATDESLSGSVERSETALKVMRVDHVTCVLEQLPIEFFAFRQSLLRASLFGQPTQGKRTQKNRRHGGQQRHFIKSAQLTRSPYQHKDNNRAGQDDQKVSDRSRALHSHTKRESAIRRPALATPLLRESSEPGRGASASLSWAVV